MLRLEEEDGVLTCARDLCVRFRIVREEGGRHIVYECTKGGFAHVYGTTMPRGVCDEGYLLEFSVVSLLRFSASSDRVCGCSLVAVARWPMTSQGL